MSEVLKRQGGVLFYTYFQNALQEARTNLNRMSKEVIIANEVDALVNNIIAEYDLEPVEEDLNRQIQALPKYELYRTNDSFYGAVEKEYTYAILEIPLIPRKSNKNLLQLQASTWPIPSNRQEITYRETDHKIVAKVNANDANDALLTIREKIRLLNAELPNHISGFRQQLTPMVQQRKADVERMVNQFEQQMATIGVSVQKKSNAIEPVNVQIKKTVQVLRNKPQSHQTQDLYLKPESVTEIVGLINNSGKGFETSPSTYTRLEEEQLRDIILGYLNAVFGGVVATGETFSKKGKTDIFINTPGGAVLVCECKYWGGRKLYNDTINQLFGYLPWRHTVAVMITFSRNKGLTKVVTEADEGIKAHNSYKQNSLMVKGITYHVSTHEHPNDTQRTVEVHHLFFDLSA